MTLITASRGNTSKETLDFVMEECINCGIPFMFPVYYKKQKQRDHTGFTCPNGHSMVYNGPSEETKLREQLERERRQMELERTEMQDRYISELRLRSEIENKLRRIHKGVCTCCNRTFANLQSHIKTKHPELLVEKKKRGRPRKS